jgi:hypothetical protein
MPHLLFRLPCLESFAASPSLQDLPQSLPSRVHGMLGRFTGFSTAFLHQRSIHGFSRLTKAIVLCTCY